MRALPIPGLKVAFDAARRFAVSAKRPDAASVVAGIDAGLRALRRRGDVARVMEEVGLFNPKVAEWTLIDPSHGENN